MVCGGGPHSRPIFLTKIQYNIIQKYNAAYSQTEPRLRVGSTKECDWFNSKVV